MFERFSRSWGLVKASYAVLRADRELLIFPLLSTIGVILITITFAIPLIASGFAEALADSDKLTNSQIIIGVVLGFLYYFVMYTIVIFANVALIGAAMIRMDGGDPTVGDGFRIAGQHFNAILGYAAISATVGMILQAIRGDEDNIAGRIVASILSMAWGLITFLVIPVLIMENLGPIAAIKRSANLLKQTWGEQIAGSFSMGMISFLIMLAVLLVVGGPILLIVASIDSAVLAGLGIGVVVIVLALIGLFFSALNGVFQAALYRYATAGTAGDFFDDNILSGAFHPKKKKREEGPRFL